MSSQVIVIGGGLSGLSAAHTILERGGRVLLLDKNAFCGGNSTKATSGINGSGTRSQKKLGIQDSNEVFEQDTALSATKGEPNSQIYPLGKVLVQESSDCVHWLEDNFGLNLSLVSRLGGHSHPRTHRGPERFPGMTITYALMEKFEKICEEQPHRARLIVKARANKLITDDRKAVVGVHYSTPEGEFTAYGPVIIATGGYAADFGDNSVLMKYRPDLKNLPTTNGDHCTGDGIKMAQEIGAGLKDMEYVQVHPTGLVHPDEPNAKVLFLAAEALRGVGGIMLNGDGERFVDELGRRDFVSESMGKNKGPFWLILNGGASNEIEWHCKHYLGRGLFRRFESAEELAKGINVPFNKLKDTLNRYNEGAKNEKDQFGRKFFKHTPWKTNDFFHVGQITPVVHYCMGGLSVGPDSHVLDTNGRPIDGLWAAGEVMGGTHGKNRLGGSSLLDCVVFGRVSGRNAASYLLSQLCNNPVSGPVSQGSTVTTNQQLSKDGFFVGTTINNGGVSQTVRVDPVSKNLSLEISWNKGSSPSIQINKQPVSSAPQQQQTQAQAPTQQTKPPAPKKSDPNTEYTVEEVSKHKSEKDCWVIINGQVLDVTTFLPDHPGGKKSILLFAGKDASEEFNMLHKPEVIQKYAPTAIIGKIKLASKL